jgi:RND family efflux transporter MFP subunit
MRAHLLLAALLLLSTLNAQEGPPPALVATETLKSGTINPLTRYVGTLRFQALSKVASQSAGAVTAVYVRTGDHLKAGEPIAQLDSEILQANIAAKEADLARTRAQAQQAVRDADRFTRLYEQKSISSQQYEEARLKAADLSAQERMSEAALQALRLEHDRRTVRAPFDGVVIEKAIEKGEWVNTGAHVATLAQKGPMEVVIHVSSRDLERIEPGQKVPVSIGSHRLQGTVAGIIPLSDSASRTFPIRITLNIPPQLKSAQGLQADVGIAQLAQKPALLLPRDAIIERFDQQVVFAVVEGKAQMFPVEVIGYDDLLAAVENPRLQEGMAIITRGNERIFPNQPVRVKKP